MPDIEGRITDWRLAMAQQLLRRGEVLDELEGHLRDEVEELMRAGHPPGRALDKAMARLGEPGALAAEFAKVPAPFAPWLPIRLACVGGLVLAVLMVAPLWPKLTAGGVNALLATHMGAVMLGYLATLLVGFLAACYCLSRPFREPSEGQARTLRRAGRLLTGAAVALTGSGIVIGSLFCPNEKTGWAFGLDTREVGGIAILAWNVGMFLAYRWTRHEGKLRGLMLLGLAGNVAVVLGWLGASAVERQLHGGPADYSTVVVLVLAQLVVGCLALAPAGCLRPGRA